jgi:hypothetical protein
MSSRDSEVVDMSKLTQRELLIRLHDKVDGLETSVKEIPKLRERIHSIEVRNITIASVFGAFALAANLFINYLKLK